jgi:hypothetical protein
MQKPLLTSADELRNWTEDRWQAFVTAVDSLDDEVWEQHADVAGWTVKDHVAHVTRWDESLIALVRDQTPRQQTLQVPDDAWHAGGYDAMNEAIRQQTIDLPVSAVRSRRDAVRAELADLLATFDDATLQRPGKEFGLDYGPHDTFLETLVDDLGVHYDQHRQYIERILATATLTTPDAYRALAEQRWLELTTFLDGLDLRDWTEWTDGSGWTVKDHVAHVVDWDAAWISQASGGATQRQVLDLPDEVWDQGVDAINAELRQRSLGLTVEQARRKLDDQIAASRATLDRVDLLQEARTLGLARPDDDRLTIEAFVEDQAEHYELHHRYMDRIVDEGRARGSQQPA